MSLEGLSQDPFDPDEFVDRLAWYSSKVKTQQSSQAQSSNPFASDTQPESEGSSQFDPMILHGAFCQTIQQLTDYSKKLEKQAQVLESQCIEEEGRQRKKVHFLLKENQVNNLCCSSIYIYCTNSSSSLKMKKLLV